MEELKQKVSIRPEVNMLSVLKYVEYETWFALAEFVDNSLASYFKNEVQLKNIEGKDFKLEINIEINEPENRITIRDNAAGINEVDYIRAFRAADVPLDRTGLSEHGMGMKSAACWFTDKWKVRSKALFEDFEKTVEFDLKKILDSKVDELDVVIKKAGRNHHYTIVELSDVTKMPRRKGLGKVKSHLASIYREFIRKNILTLKVDGKPLQFEDPKILTAKFQEKPYVGIGEPITWKEEVNFEVSEGLSVHGFVAIRETGSTGEAGFALFRRGRVIEGSYDNGFRHEYIFGNPNSYRYQRVFGELHLEGFDANFTKKGIRWGENLEKFLQELRLKINSKTFPLLTQAENYRARATDEEYKKLEKPLNKTVTDFEKRAPQAMADVVNTAPLVEEPLKNELIQTEKTLHREFELRFNKENWKVSMQLSYDPSLNELIEVGDGFIKNKSKDESVRQIGIRLSLTHPFMVEFVGADNSKIEPILRIAAALGLSEVIAKGSGIKTQGEVRRNFNELISNLSK